MSGRVHEEVGPEPVGCIGKLADVGLELEARVAPREVRVRLAEAQLGQRRHDCRARERLGQEHDVGMVLVHGGDQPLPEREWFGVRVVHSEHPDAVIDPVLDHAEERLPQLLRLRAVEVDVDDVLIALRRVLRVLHRAVGPPREPLGVLLEPRVVGRALHGEVERDLEAELAGASDEAVEVVEGSEIGMHGLVATLGPADRPGAPRIGGRRHQRVVPPLAVGGADGVDRRQVHHVEAEIGDLGQHRPYAVEPAERPWEQLVPGLRTQRARAHLPPSTGARAMPSPSVPPPARRARSRRPGARRRAAARPRPARRATRSRPPRPCAAARRARSRRCRPRRRRCTPTGRSSRCGMRR